MGSVFKASSSGIREALSLPGVYDATYAKACEIRAECDAYANPHRTDKGGRSFAAHRGSNSRVGIANVSTRDVAGMNIQSKHHVLQKCGGV